MEAGPDTEDALLRRRVLRVSIFLLAAGIGSIVWAVAGTHLWNVYTVCGMLATVLGAIGVPLCGIGAVKQHSRDLLQYFVGCNALCACCFLFNLILGLVFLSYVPTLKRVCYNNDDIPKENCKAYDEAKQARVLLLTSAVGFASFVANIVAVRWGKELLESPTYLAAPGLARAAAAGAAGYGRMGAGGGFRLARPGHAVYGPPGASAYLPQPQPQPHLIPRPQHVPGTAVVHTPTIATTTPAGQRL